MADKKKPAKTPKVQPNVSKEKPGAPAKKASKKKK